MSVCPRCANKGYLERRRVGDHIYLYFVHERREGGRRKRLRCYLGATKYTYVEKFNPLDLSGLHDKERFMRYAMRLLDELSPEQLKWLKGALHHKSVGVNEDDGEDKEV